MAENKFAKIPVSSHGLHKHKYNYPWLSSINFGDVMPCYYNTIRKGEKDHPKAGMASQLMPVEHNAFATGRYNFKAIFVPYKFVWRPWYSFDTHTEFVSNGSSSFITSYPFVSQGVLSNAFITSYCGVGSSTDYDIAYATIAGGVTSTSYYKVSDTGRRILRILMALGSTPSFVSPDSNTVNILPILCYLKAFADYYFPNNYVGNTAYKNIDSLFKLDTVDYSSYISNILSAIDIASVNFYDSSIFDNVWENPTTPNVFAGSPSVEINDITVSGNGNSGYKSIVKDNTNYNSSSTPVIVGASSNGTVGPTTSPYQISQYIIEALKSVSMWAKRHQLSGARIIDRFLVSRGVELSNDSAQQSYFIGQRNIEIEVSAIANTTDTNLGELAGRGVASSGDKPIEFNVKADDDGIFLVLVSAIPDATYPVVFDGFCARNSYFDNYIAEYDKLGSAAVPARVITQSFDGVINNTYKDSVFGFANQYWDEVQERPRLLGDFVLLTQGAKELEAYHTFRLLDSSAVHSMSYNFVRMSDKSQYQRLFYSNKQENLMLFLRWYGEQYKEKLPLGDSYDWDDDELNRRVNIVVSGPKK